MLGYLAADIICSEKRRFRRAKLEENCELRQMKAIVYLFMIILFRSCCERNIIQLEGLARMARKGFFCFVLRRVAIKTML